MRKSAAIALLAFAAIVSADHAVAIRQFIVFFSAPEPEKLDPIQWHITAEGDAVLSEVAVVFKAYPDNAIHLIAGDQNVGAIEVSIERSRRRADAVKQSLIEKGVPAKSIVIHACGFRRLMVSTPPGTIEPMNRYVALDIDIREREGDRCAQ